MIICLEFHPQVQIWFFVWVKPRLVEALAVVHFFAKLME